MTRTRSSIASVAPRPRAIRLDELPAEVWALCRTAVQDHLKYKRTATTALLAYRWPACAGPAGMRGPSHRAVCALARALDTGLCAADSLQVRTAARRKIDLSRAPVS